MANLTNDGQFGDCRSLSADCYPYDYNSVWKVGNVSLSSELGREENKRRRKLDKLNSFIKSLQGFVENGAQGRSLSAILGLRDTGASLHIGIEPPTRGFSIQVLRQ